VFSDKFIFINGRFLAQPMTGVQRFASELLRALDLILENDQTFLQSTKIICLISKETEDNNLLGWKNIPVQKCGRMYGNKLSSPGQLHLNYKMARNMQ
jgi:hypothetical protein